MSGRAAPVAPGQRYPLLDVLRGFALLGIVLVNMEGYSTALDGAGWGDFSGAANDVGTWLITSLAALKFYTLFSLLFGYGLAVQVMRADGLGALIPRYKRRLLGLFILGLLHAVLFYWGDILMLYAVVGLTLIPLSRMTDRQVLRVAGWAFAAGAAIIVLAGLAALAAGPTETDAAAVEATRAAYAEGSLGEILSQRLDDAVFGQIIVLLAQGPTVFAAFALGLVLGRRGVLARPAEHRRLFRRVAAIGLPIGLAGGLLAAALDPLGSSDTSGLGIIVLFLAAPFLTLGYVSVFGLAPERLLRSPTFALLRAPGRMSLSVYLLESIVAAFIFTAIGFGQFQNVDAGQAVLLALGIWAALAVLSILWLKPFRFGPFEWALRSWTYRRRQPLRQRAP